MIKLIEYNNQTYAKIIRASYQPKDTEFFTSENDEIQFGTVKYKKNYKTGAHYHNKNQKKTIPIDEIIVIKEGSVRIDFYTNEGNYLKSCEVFKDDTIIFYQGAHNIIFYENTDVLKIKTGAWDKCNNKTRIIGTNNLELLIEND